MHVVSTAVIYNRLPRGLERDNARHFSGCVAVQCRWSLMRLGRSLAVWYCARLHWCSWVSCILQCIVKQSILD